MGQEDNYCGVICFPDGNKFYAEKAAFFGDIKSADVIGMVFLKEPVPKNRLLSILDGTDASSGDRR